MKLTNDIEIYKLGLLIKSEQTLVIGDLHLGYEESLNKYGINHINPHTPISG